MSEQKTIAASNEISRLAYLLWEQAGRPSGRDLEFWLKAESQLAKKSVPENPVPAAPSLAVNKMESMLKKRFTAPRVETPVTTSMTPNSSKKRKFAP